MAIGSIQKALLLSAILIVTGKISGIFRDITMAFVFGANEATDAFFVANIVPSILLAAFYSTIPLAFIPLYVKKLKELPEERANAYANSVLTLYLLITVGITIAAFATAPFVVDLLASEFDANQKALSIRLVRIFSVSFMFSVSCGFLSAVQYSHDIRVGQQISPVINNTIFIVAVLAVGGTYGIEFAAAATVAGWLLQLPIQYLFARPVYKPAITALPANADIGALYKISAPVFLSFLLEQAILANAVFFASQAEQGSVSLVTYANKLSNLPVTLSAMLVTIYFYAPISRIGADGKIEEFRFFLSKATKTIVFLLIPITVMSVLLSEHIARVIFGFTKLTEFDISSVAMLFVIYVSGAVFLILRDLLNRYLYVTNASSLAFYVTCLFVVMNSTLSYFLFPKYGLNGLALSTTISAVLAFALQITFVFRRIGKPSVDLRYLSASIFSAILITLVCLSTNLLPTQNSFVVVASAGAVALIAHLAIFKMLSGFKFLGVTAAQ